MKSENIFGIIGTILVIGLVAYFSVDYFKGKNLSSFKVNINGTSDNDNTLIASNIANHATVDDCWLIISNNVYDVTDYLSLHPGGQSIIIPYCGRDATQAFTTKGGRGSHSSFADIQLGDYFIGDLSNK